MTHLTEDPDSKISELQISRASALEGLKWISHSFSLFGKSPSIWVVMLVIYFALSLVLTMIPILALLPAFLAPIFNAGFVYGAKTVDNKQMLEIDHLFAGFKLQLRGLFRLGMIYFLVNLIIITLSSIVLQYGLDENTIVAISKATNAVEFEQLLYQYPALATALFKALVFGFILSIPLIMASWFAPALILFHQMTPSKAMILSLKACNKNMPAFLFYGVLILPLLLLAILPLGLGLLIMLPVIFISQYCSYKTIFFQQQQDQGVFIV